MATKRRRAGSPQRLDRDLMEQLLFGTGRARRFTQDSPVLPDVWLQYAKQPEDADGGQSGAAARPGRRRGHRRVPAGQAAPHAVSRGPGGRGAPQGARAPARRAPDGGVAVVRPRAGAIAPGRVQPLHGGRDPPLRGSGPRRAADDRVVASSPGGLDARRHRRQDLAALARAGDQGPRAPAGAVGARGGEAPVAGALGPPVDDPRGGRPDDRAQRPAPPTSLHDARGRRGGDGGRLADAGPGRGRAGARGHAGAARDGLLGEPEPGGVADGGAVDAGDQGRRGAAPVRHLVPGAHVGSDRQRHRRAPSRLPHPRSQDATSR